MTANVRWAFGFSILLLLVALADLIGGPLGLVPVAVYAWALVGLWRAGPGPVSDRRRSPPSPRSRCCRRSPSVPPAICSTTASRWPDGPCCPWRSYSSTPAVEMLEKHVQDGDVVVPEGFYLVLGDNRDASLDSRCFGFVPRANALGVVRRVLFSVEENKTWLTGLRGDRWSRPIE